MLVDAWTAARQRTDARNREDAEAKAEGRPRLLPTEANLSMRRVYEREKGKTDNAEFPCRDYLQWRIDQFELTEFRAELLTEVVSVSAAGDDNFDNSVDFSVTLVGRIQVRRDKLRAPVLSTPEELRHRYRLMRTLWEVMKYKHADGASSSTTTGAFGKRWSRTFWGQKCMAIVRGITAASVGRTFSTMNIRKLAMETLNERTANLSDALRAACKDTDLRSTHFLMQVVTPGKRDAGASSGQTNHEDETASKQASTIANLQKQIKDLKKGTGKQGGASGSGGKGKQNRKRRKR